MATIPQLRNRLLEGFSEKQADLLAHVVIEAHDDLVNQADFHALTGVVRELADAQKELADAQKDLADAQRRTEERVEELADAQKRTEGTLTDVVKTQQKMLIRLDRLDGHMLEDKVAKNLPAFLGREFRRCRVLDRAEFVEGLEPRLPEAELADLMRADVIAVAKRAEQLVHLVVEVSCTADADDLDRAVRRAAALASAGFTAIGIVACESISPQTLAAARTHGLRVLTNGWLLPEAA
jgi:TolA-binding protein